jgi:hypothetical protein
MQHTLAAIGHIDVGSVVEQRCDDVVVALLDGQMQQRLSEARQRIDIGTLCQ